MRALFFIVFASLATTATADEPMSAEAFQTYSEGRTLYFLENGQTYGAEQYLPGRRVIWTFLDGECQMGHWYAEGPAICFLYETRPTDPQCWNFFQTEDGVSAQFISAPEKPPLVAVLKNTDPLICPGPKVGV
ncbi:hypothetical protein [Actibacterium pelagium]|uniref:Uncharacterized protein n=1 Tax=Actibacterium pelagium TaxID=2029103 RepID=A0A917AM27_9RHOB|nr:hypothetical protein [Actibacterium pelagium]GGE60079.1 hypothetical protein GCM10011517_29600 [Actibacterium pelagium]